jgi:hypothetical protein
LQADAGGLLFEMEQLLDLAGGQRRALPLDAEQPVAAE